MLDWIRQHQDLLERLGALSVAAFLLGLIAVPILAARIPDDYFLRDRRQPALRRSGHPVVSILAGVVKNLLGIVFIVAGLAMLVLPGQGLLSILFGVMLTDFPGKYTFEKKVAQQPAVTRTINWLRAKAHKGPLRFAPSDVDDSPPTA